jgi:hypothetical protein
MIKITSSEDWATSPSSADGIEDGGQSKPELLIEDSL